MKIWMQAAALAFAIATPALAHQGFVPREEVDRDNDARHYRKKSSNGVKPGHYTDDTQMSLAIAEAIVDRVPWNPRNLANYFVKVYRRDPLPCYARCFEGILKQC